LGEGDREARGKRQEAKEGNREQGTGNREEEGKRQEARGKRRFRVGALFQGIVTALLRFAGFVVGAGLLC
jgi:hypothetical protein